RDRWPRLSVTESEKRHHARPEAHRGNAIAASRRRHFGDRALAWSRTNRNNPGLRARRSGTQGARLGENCPRQHETRALPPARQGSWLPGGNLIIMPTSASRPPPPRPTSTYTSAYSGRRHSVPWTNPLRGNCVPSTLISSQSTE